MILVMPDNPKIREDAPRVETIRRIPRDGRFYRVSFNGGFITSQAATVISSGVMPLFTSSWCTPAEDGRAWGTENRVFRKCGAQYESRISPISGIHVTIKKVRCSIIAEDTRSIEPQNSPGRTEWWEIGGVTFIADANNRNT